MNKMTQMRFIGRIIRGASNFPDGVLIGWFRDEEGRDYEIQELLSALNEPQLIALKKTIDYELNRRKRK